MGSIRGLWLAGLLGSGVLLACQQKEATPAEPATAPATKPATPPATPPPAAGAKALLQPALEALCQMDLQGAASIFTTDHVCRLASTVRPPIVGREGQRKLWSEVQLAFPDLRAYPLQVLETPEVWVLEGVLLGTHQGKFLGVDPTGRKAGCQFALYAWVENGKIKRSFLVGNPQTVLKQLTEAEGKAPPVPDAPEQPVLSRDPGDTTQIEKVKAFFAAFDAGDWTKLGDLVAEDVVVYAYGDGKKLSGKKALLGILGQEHDALQGQAQVLHAMTTGPWVAIHIEVSGQLVKDLGPLKAGPAFSEEGVDVFFFEGGKIKEWRNYRNQADLMAQLSPR